MMPLFYGFVAILLLVVGACVVGLMRDVEHHENWLSRLDNKLDHEREIRVARELDLAAKFDSVIKELEIEIGFFRRMERQNKTIAIRNREDLLAMRDDLRDMKRYYEHRVMTRKGGSSR